MGSRRELVSLTIRGWLDGSRFKDCVDTGKRLTSMQNSSIPNIVLASVLRRSSNNSPFIAHVSLFSSSIKLTVTNTI